MVEAGWEKFCTKRFCGQCSDMIMMGKGGKKNLKICNALLSSHSCCPLGSQTLLTSFSLSESCLCNEDLCQDDEGPEEDEVDSILFNQVIDEINSCNGGLRGDRICEETKEKFDGPIECPATSTTSVTLAISIFVLACSILVATIALYCHFKHKNTPKY